MHYVVKKTFLGPTDRDQLLPYGSKSSNTLQHCFTKTSSSIPHSQTFKQLFTSLDSLTSVGRSSVYFCSVHAFAEHTKTLPKILDRLTLTEMTSLIVCLVVSCSAQASQKWIGIVPDHLQDQVITLLETAMPATKTKREWCYVSQSENLDYNLWGRLQEKLNIYASAIRYCLNCEFKASSVISTSSWSKSKWKTHTRERQRKGIQAGTYPNTVKEASLSSSPWQQHRFLNFDELLQDLVIYIAESVTDCYLDETQSAQSSYTPNTPLNTRMLFCNAHRSQMVHPTLVNTRSLEKFRNRMLLQRTLEKYLYSVLAIYEDVYNLLGFDASNGKTKRKRMFLKRSSEISYLTGLRMWVSFFVEVTDVVLPALRSLVDLVAHTLFSSFTNIAGSLRGYVSRDVEKRIRFCK